MKNLNVLAFLLSLGILTSCQEKSPWENLYNGKDLSNWTILNGEAPYETTPQGIIGISTAHTPNTFLTTQKKYGDFILELEVKVDPELNSGIQIRSHSIPEYKNGRFHGYQVEIDPSNRKWSGGIYDEGRRGWLYPLTENEEGANAFKNNQWNAYHIEAIGNDLKVWVNGVQTSHVVDDMDSDGYIALQVHAIYDENLAGKTIEWNNIRIMTQNLQDHQWKEDPNFKQYNYTQNLTDWQKAQGWNFLWDGKTTNGWISAKGDQFPEKGWEIKDGVLSVIESGGAEANYGGDIITTQSFGNFELELDFKISEGANSGIKYFVDPQLNQGVGSAIGCEFQLLDDKNHPDAKMGTNGNRTLASLYDLITAENLSEGSTDKRFKGIGEWNTARILVNGSHVEHWLNHVKMVEYDRHTEYFKSLVKSSKYEKYPDFGQATSGPILLQDHGNNVSFRNIKIKTLPHE